MEMRTFKGQPNLVVRFNPPIGNIKHVKFNENGEFTTANERVIQRFMHHYDSVPVKTADEPETKVYQCKQCEYKTESRGELMSHYRSNHKEG